MNVLIAGGGTGGHLMPALAIADALVAERPDVEPVMVGARRGVDADILPRRPYRHYLLPAEPIHRRAWWRNVKWPWLAWRLLRECCRILDSERPVFAVGTGGYAAGPMLLSAARRGVPIALQEQNAYPGLTTRWLARSASQVYLGFPEAAAHLRLGSTTQVFTYGNPIIPPPEPWPERQEARRALGIVGDAPVVFVTGGSQGALGINETVAACLAEGRFEGLVVLWSVGARHIERYVSFDAPPTRQVRAFWDPIAEAYAAADLVIARAGGTAAELCAWGLPAILVPLPTAAADHQRRNAEALAAAGAAVHLPQRDLSPERLATTVHRLLGEADELARMGQAARARGQPDAARRTAATLLAMAP